MSLRPQEVLRSESTMEGGLSGPANSLTAESIDCGCGPRYPLSRLAKLATRRIFLALLCCIGVLQAAAQAYFHVTSSTVARRFHIDPYLMEWILCMSEIAWALLGIAVAYWGDRIHRASWLGSLTLLQCAAFLALVVPHISYDKDVIVVKEDSSNITHMSIYSEESPDLCMKMSSRLIAAEDPPQIATLCIMIAVQIVTGMANVAFYALGISYLDDNTKRVHVPVYLGVVLATKVLGSFLGYALGWGFLRIDADNLSPISSYRNQYGAWWLGWPIFAILLAVPAICMSIFPRKLPSEMVEQVAATILDQSGTLRGSQRTSMKKVGNPEFLPSMLRILTNKILICNVLGAAFAITAITNFIANENIFLESRFYAPRPTGLFLGFGDPLVSRAVTTMTKPILIGLIIIITGLLIARVRPDARTLVNYNFVILIGAALIILCLAFDNCEKKPVVGVGKGSISLRQYCNMYCGCSPDADFRPVCAKSGTFTFYSPCHAGCTSVRNENNMKIYNNCECVKEITGLGNYEATDGPCDSDGCQVGWMVYEIVTMLVYSAVASIVVGDLLISLRSVNAQDKALTIGYSMTMLGFIAYVPGKISYDELAKSTCLRWGTDDHVCRLYNSTNLGNYLCFLTSGLMFVSALFKVVVWFFCSDIEMYDQVGIEVQQAREMKEMSKTQSEPLLQPQSTWETEESNNNEIIGMPESVPDPIVLVETKTLGKENGPVPELGGEEASASNLKYGPVGPGNRRVTKNQSNASIANVGTDDELDSSDGSQVLRKGSSSQVSYKPLEIDSDVESDLSGAVARSRKRISGTELDQSNKALQGIQPPFSNIRFPNPDNYEDPRVVRSFKNDSPTLAPDGSSKTDSFKYAKKRKDDEPLSASKGDFNEVGIPLVESYEATVKGSMNSLRSPTIMMAIQHLDRNPNRELFEENRFIYKPIRKTDTEEIEENRKFRLEKLMQPVNYSPASPRPPSRDQASSGFGSLQDMPERIRLQQDSSDSHDSLSSKSSASGLPKIGGPLCTDL